MEDFELLDEIDVAADKDSSSTLFYEVNSFFLNSELDLISTDNSRSETVSSFHGFGDNSQGVLNSSSSDLDAPDSLKISSDNTSSSASSISSSTMTRKKDADEDRPRLAPKKKIKLDKVTITYGENQPPITSGLLDFPRKLTQAFNAGNIVALSKLVDNYCVDQCKLITIVSDDAHEGKVYIKEFFKKLLQVSPDSIITFHNELFVDNNIIFAQFSCTGTIVVADDAGMEQARRLFFKDGIVLSDKVVDTSKLSKEKIIKLKELEKELKKKNKPIVHITNGIGKYSYAMCDDGIERLTVFEYVWRTSMIKDGSLEI